MSFFRICFPVISALFCMLMQVLSCKYFLKGRLLVSWYAGSLSGFAVLFLFESLSIGSAFPVSAPLVLADMVIYASFIYCYFHFINMGETARRIRLLRELSASPEGLTMDEILSRYNADEIIERRILRLLNNGQLVKYGGRYYLGKPVMALFAGLIDLMKIVIFGGKGKTKGKR